MTFYRRLTTPPTRQSGWCSSYLIIIYYNIFERGRLLGSTARCGGQRHLPAGDHLARGFMRCDEPACTLTATFTSRFPSSVLPRGPLSISMSSCTFTFRLPKVKFLGQGNWTMPFRRREMRRVHLPQSWLDGDAVNLALIFRVCEKNRHCLLNATRCQWHLKCLTIICLN